MRARLLGGEAEGESRDSREDELERQLLRRRVKSPLWSIDRGGGAYHEARERNKHPSLVATGRHAGRSRVLVTGLHWALVARHLWARDFYTSAVNASFWKLLIALPLLYISVLLFWAVVYYVTWTANRECFIGFFTFQSAFMFAVETQATIGYGTRSVHTCWLPAVEVALHSITGLMVSSVFIGIMFAKLSHPRNRGRTILLSDCACVARRDGLLRFMIRVGDMRDRKVISPRIRAYLHMWGGGRLTEEGERIPVQVTEMKLSDIQSDLLLPEVVHHTIDERSPLFGHTQASLQAAGAEVVVVFTGSTELGSFQARQSYLPTEIFWGHTFAAIISPAPPGTTRHVVDLSRFHDVEPQPGYESELATPQALSLRVVAGRPRSVPGPLLSQNTLVLSDEATVTPRGGRLFLCFRVGDSLPGQMQRAEVRAYLYRWRAGAMSPEGELRSHTVEELVLDQQELMLRLPATVCHDMSACSGSPLSGWTAPEAMLADADAEIVVTVQATVYADSSLAVKSRVYEVLTHVRWGHAFAPAVRPPSKLATPTIDWSAFHATYPLAAAAAAGAAPHALGAALLQAQPPSAAAAASAPAAGPAALAASTDFSFQSVAVGSTATSGSHTAAPGGLRPSAGGGSSSSLVTAASVMAHGAADTAAAAPQVAAAREADASHSATAAVAAAAARAVSSHAAGAADLQHRAGDALGQYATSAAAGGEAASGSGPDFNSHGSRYHGSATGTTSSSRPICGSSRCGSGGAGAASPLSSSTLHSTLPPGQSWREKRSLFDAVDALNQLSKEELEELMAGGPGPASGGGGSSTSSTMRKAGGRDGGERAHLQPD